MASTTGVRAPTGFAKLKVGRAVNAAHPSHGTAQYRSPSNLSPIVAVVTARVAAKVDGSALPRGIGGATPLTAALPARSRPNSGVRAGQLLSINGDKRASSCMQRKASP